MIERSDELVKYFKDRNAGAAEIANEIHKIAKNLVVEKGPFGKEQLVPYTNFLLESARKNHYSVQVIKNTGPEDSRGFYTRQIEVLQQLETEILLELKRKLRPLRSLSKKLDVYF
nr:PREDICTED: uncharacterized protein LOC109041463 [Bemisia tabaci]